MYRHHQFSGDPHPGNSLLLDDGRMAFLDFGLFKRIPAAVAEFELEIARLGIAGDGAGARSTICTRAASSRSPRSYTPEGILAQVHDMTWWYGVDDEVALTPEIATEIMIEMSDPRSSHFAKMRHETLPPDHLFGRRLEMLTLAVMSQLRARGNWHRIAREWIYDDEPGHRARPPGGRVLRRSTRRPPRCAAPPDAGRAGCTPPRPRIVCRSDVS